MNERVKQKRACFGANAHLFSEFNRISVEVLSVVAVQVKSVQDAIRDKKDIFNFMGEMIKCVPTVGIFITMNPGESHWCATWLPLQCTDSQSFGFLTFQAMPAEPNYVCKIDWLGSMYFIHIRNCT